MRFVASSWNGASLTASQSKISMAFWTALSKRLPRMVLTFAHRMLTSECAAPVKVLRSTMLKFDESCSSRSSLPSSNRFSRIRLSDDRTTLKPPVVPGAVEWLKAMC